MITEGLKNITAGANPIIIRRGMQKATTEAVEAIKGMTKQLIAKTTLHVLLLFQLVMMKLVT